MASGQGIGELRLRVEGSFTASELKELARKWGLSPEPSWDRSTSDLVRGLLKDAERMFGQSELVRRLRTEKPLVEWPDVESKDAEKWGPKSGDMGIVPPEAPPSTTLADGTSIRRAYPEEQTEVRGPDLGPLDIPVAEGDRVTVEAAPLEPAAQQRAEQEAPVSLRVASDAAPVSSAAPGSSAAAPVSAGPTSSGPRSLGAPFPGTTVPVEKPRAGIDPKVLIVVASLMFGLAVVAFGAGLLWSRRGSSTPTDSPKTASSVKTNGLAGRALSVFDDALLSVATRCEVDVDGPPTSEILASAQEGCGRSVRESKRRIADPNLPSSPDPSHPRPRDPSTADDPRPVRPSTGGLPARPSCISGCAGAHSDCMANCGAEPGDASKFDVWQACSGRCLAAESRCRLQCR